jgi:hypothetical protein
MFRGILSERAASLAELWFPPFVEHAGLWEGANGVNIGCSRRHQQFRSFFSFESRSMHDCKNDAR